MSNKKPKATKKGRRRSTLIKYYRLNSIAAFPSFGIELSESG